MKQLVLLLLSCFLAFNVHSQHILHSTLSKFENGRIYTLNILPMSSNIQKDKTQILKIVFPKWEEKLDTIFKVLPYRNIKIKDEAVTMKFVETDRNCLCARHIDYLSLGIVKIPEKHFNTSFIEGDFKIIKVQKLVRPASIELVDAELVKIESQFIKLELQESYITYFRDNENNIVYVKLKPEVSWGDWQQMACTHPRPATPTVGDICMLLKELGYYSGQKVYKMNASLKDALVKFQKDKGLPRGSLDFETLKALSYSRPLTLFSEIEKLNYTLNGNNPPKYRSPWFR